MRRACIVTLGVVLCAAGCSHTAKGPDAAAIREAITAVNDEFLGCFEEGGSADCVASYFSEEGQQLLSNTPAHAGPEAIRRFWNQAFAWGQWEVSFNSMLIEPNEPMALERGRYTFRFTAGSGAPPGRPSTQDRGTYLVQWRHDPDGKWRIAVQAFVSEMPARLVSVPGQAPAEKPQAPDPDEPGTDPPAAGPGRGGQ
jgi:ketosteroid isomerase-like protein